MRQGKWAFKPSENWRELSAKDSVIRRNCALLRSNGINPSDIELTDLKSTRGELMKKFNLKESDLI
ncbi:MAG: hypothetical protein COT15_02075 [Candidatus Diapherotrites archaeon CG08_land_8_20_14_0_20_34_12]|nr:MAG: hypothetical protein COT15_02075 [Candidatus Diapherotrites archaeon CG08_land_8_20_14_0_20_34_12]